MKALALLFLVSITLPNKGFSADQTVIQPSCNPGEYGIVAVDYDSHRRSNLSGDVSWVVRKVKDTYTVKSICRPVICAVTLDKKVFRYNKTLNRVPRSKTLYVSPKVDSTEQTYYNSDDLLSAVENEVAAQSCKLVTVEITIDGPKWSKRLLKKTFSFFQERGIPVERL